MPKTIHVIRKHTAQKEIIRSKTRFRVVACGRRFGKTEIGKYEIVLTGARGGHCWWLAPTYLMASQVWRDVKALCARVPGLELDESERRMDWPNGGMIAIRSTHYADNLRGAGLDFAVFDEAAFMEPSVWPQVVRPMLLERQGRALFLSTPYGRNWFWELYQMGLDPSQRTWRSFHFTTLDNPLLDAEELAQIRLTTPDHVWREEYLAEFIETDGQVFRGVQAAATAPLHTAPQPGTRYIGGVDWGREGDYTVIALIDADSRRLVALDRFHQVSWSLQRGRLQVLCEHWRPVVVWAEANSVGSVNIEALQAEGLPVHPFHTTAQSKRPLIEGLALAIERGDLALLPDETLLSELAAYRLERLPGGGYRYGAPSGLHDDTVIALALAWHGVQQGSLLVDFA